MRSSSGSVKLRKRVSMNSYLRGLGLIVEMSINCLSKGATGEICRDAPLLEM